MSAAPRSDDPRPLWTAAEAAAATGGTACGDWMADGVAIDSRRVAPGSLFVALRGENHDAHAFVVPALNAGAAAAVVDRWPSAAPADAPLLIVADTTRALSALGAAARTRTAAAVIAVTGSVGKTGTKEMLGRAFGALGATTISQGNLNNHLGVPLSLARLPADDAYGVFELGMNRAGEIRALAGLTRPHVAIVTRIAPAHVGFFAGVWAIADAKSEIFEGLVEGGTAILNRDDTWFGRLADVARRRGRLLTFGAHAASDIRLLDQQVDADGSQILASLAGERISYWLGQPGRHWVQNSLAVLAAVFAVGGDLARAAAALAVLPTMVGRGRRLPIPAGDGEALLIDEAYNSSPAACRAALETLASIHRSQGAVGRRIVVLGDMLEMGDEAERLHIGLAPALQENGIDCVFTVGPEMRRLYDTLSPSQRGGAFECSRDAIAPVRAALGPGDTILIKGSLGMRMAPIVAALCAPSAESDPPRAVCAPTHTAGSDFGSGMRRDSAFPRVHDREKRSSRLDRPRPPAAPDRAGSP